MKIIVSDQSFDIFHSTFFLKLSLKISKHQVIRDNESDIIYEEVTIEVIHNLPQLIFVLRF